MRKFDLEAAKNGARVVTRDGREVEILKYDLNSTTPIVAVITYGNGTQTTFNYFEDGKVCACDKDSEWDLFMKPVKREGWVNLYEDEYGRIETGITVFVDKETAINLSRKGEEIFDTIKIEWEEK